MVSNFYSEIESDTSDKDCCNRAEATKQARERIEPFSCGTSMTSMDSGEAFPRASFMQLGKRSFWLSRGRRDTFALPPAPQIKSLGNRTRFYHQLTDPTVRMEQRLQSAIGVNDSSLM